jgi:hypothetical protein
MSLLATGHFSHDFRSSIWRFCARELKVLPGELPIARVPSGIVTLKNRTQNPVAQLFVDAARKVAKAADEEKMIDEMSGFDPTRGFQTNASCSRDSHNLFGRRLPFDHLVGAHELRTSKLVGIVRPSA